MPTEPGDMSQPRGRSLRDYITGLLVQLGQGEPPALDRLRAAIGPRRALIALDSEAVVVSFHGPELVVRQVTAPSGDDGPANLGDADGIGAADSAIVLDLLDGRQELADAVAWGRISATGSPEAINMILHAIEILLDASTRVPQLRALSAEFRAGRPADLNSRPNPPSALAGETEEELLARLDLLPDRQEHSRPATANL
jgi:hypothetical protein